MSNLIEMNNWVDLARGAKAICLASTSFSDLARLEMALQSYLLISSWSAATPWYNHRL